MCHLSKSAQLLTLTMIVMLVACSPAVTPIPPTATAIPPTPIPPTSIPPTQTPLPATPIPTQTSSINFTAQEVKQLGADLDTMMQKITDANMFSGAVLVAQNGQVILSKGYGLADREKKTPNTAQTKFRIASLTKQFTAMAIMLLQEQGKLNVQDKICKYIKDCPAAWQPITIHHLLTHTSGMYDSMPTFYNKETTSSQKLEEMIAETKTKPLSSPPGETFEYNDTGYAMLGKIIEAASGESYEAFLQKNIFEPHGMSNTGFGPDQSDLAVGYNDQFDLADKDNWWVLFAAAGLYSTVEDLYRWDQALYTDKLVTQKMLDTVFTAQAQMPDGTGYGYGWMIAPATEGRTVYHFGGVDGFGSFIGRYLDDKATIIILANQASPDPSVILDLIIKKLVAAK